jgi:hypothetical protein
MIEALQFDFMRYALLAGVLVSIACCLASLPPWPWVGCSGAPASGPIP